MKEVDRRWERKKDERGKRGYNRMNENEIE